MIQVYVIWCKNNSTYVKMQIIKANKQDECFPGSNKQYSKAIMKNTKL